MQDFHGAKAAVFIGPRLLVYLRDDLPGLPFANCWDFPGGGRDGDETPEQTLFREIDEEFGLSVDAAAVRWKRIFPSMHSPDSRVWFFVLSLPPETETAIRFGDEGQEWRLMTWAEFDGQDRVVPSFRPRMEIWRQETGGVLD
jgi:8-oxo-dGTP diphosphatase